MCMRVNTYLRGNRLVPVARNIKCGNDHMSDDWARNKGDMIKAHCNSGADPHVRTGLLEEDWWLGGDWSPPPHASRFC